MIDRLSSFVEENLIATVLIVFFLLFAGVAGFNLSFSEPRDYQGMDCSTVTQDYNVRCSDVDTYQDRTRSVSEPNSSYVWIRLTSVEHPIHGDEPVYTFWMYNNGFAESGDYGSSIGPEDLNVDSSDFRALENGTEAGFEVSGLRNRDDDVFIDTSEGEFNFDKDPEGSNEQHVSNLDLGSASVDAEEVRVSGGALWLKFDFYDIAKQSVENSFPGEFESLSSYGSWIMQGTVSTSFGGDSDGDGFLNRVDACPETGDQGFGLDSSGCPVYPDGDGDGVRDSRDECPSTWGSKSSGCPNIWDQLANLFYGLPGVSR